MVAKVGGIVTCRHFQKSTSWHRPSLIFIGSIEREGNKNTLMARGSGTVWMILERQRAENRGKANVQSRKVPAARITETLPTTSDRGAPTSSQSHHTDRAKSNCHRIATRHGRWGQCLRAPDPVGASRWRDATIAILRGQRVVVPQGYRSF